MLPKPACTVTPAPATATAAPVSPDAAEEPGAARSDPIACSRCDRASQPPSPAVAATATLAPTAAVAPTTTAVVTPATAVHGDSAANRPGCACGCSCRCTGKHRADGNDSGHFAPVRSSGVGEHGRSHHRRGDCGTHERLAAHADAVCQRPLKSTKCALATRCSISPSATI